MAWAVSVPPASSQSANDGFDPNVNGSILGITVQPDGRILIAGSFTDVGGVVRSNIARLNVDGSVDPTFIPLEVSRDNECCGSVRSMMVQPDGKIVIAGMFTRLGEHARTNLARLNTDGTVDPSFNSGRLLGGVNAIALQPDGKILVGGKFGAVGGQPRQGLARLNPDGSADSLSVFGNNSVVDSLIVQPDGKILVGGSFDTMAGVPCTNIGRLKPDGSVDPAFHAAANGSGVTRLALQADAKIVVAGHFTTLSGQTRTNLGRLNPDGSVDASFDSSAIVGGCSGCSPVNEMLVQPDGRILVGGYFTRLGEQPRSRIGRLNADGTVDGGFNPGANDTVWGLAVQADDKILVGGAFTTLGGTNRNHLGRLYLDGSVDATLDLGPMPPSNAVLGLAAEAAGRVLVGGVFEALGGQPRTNIGRLEANGRLDLAFNPGGPQYSGLVRSFITQPDGRIVVAGMGMRTLDGRTVTNIGCLNPDGTLDTSFIASVDLASPDPIHHFGMHGLAAQPDGKILVSGNFNRVNGQPRTNLARLNADGSLDTTFTAGTEWSEWYSGPYVRSVAVQADGKIIVGGQFRTMNGLPATNLCRLNPDGSLDAAFASSADGEVFALAVQADGSILVGGIFSALGGQPRTCLGRLLADGSVDPGFAPLVLYSTGDNYPGVWSLALQTDGRILVGGAFTNLAGQPRTHLGRLRPDGNADPSFNPSVSGVSSSAGSVLALAVQADGKVVVGGGFAALDGQVRNRIGRLTSGTAALQSLAVNAGGTVATWMRSGSSPEVEQVTFEQSSDGTHYMTLGTATRIPGGWELAGVSLPIAQSFYLRARGRATGGMFNGSGSLIESVRQLYLPPLITSVAKLADGSLTLRGAGPASQPCVLFTASNLPPALAWSPIATNTADASGLVTFPDLTTTNSPTRFYQLRWK